MIKSMLLLSLSGYLVALSHALTFAIPFSPPANASALLSPAPIGVSIEFFAFPAYFNNVPSTKQCLQNLKDLTGVWPPMRIGGTTQDRATYNSSSSDQVTYTVASSADAPSSLTFGPSFFTLANSYAGNIILGLNRRLNNLPNTISAASRALSSIATLDAIELGNEPNFFTAPDPIAGGSSWTAPRDFSSQVSWQSAVGVNLSKTDIFSAGVYFGTSPMSIQGLTAVENDSLQYVKDFCSHNYPQSSPNYNLASLMSHSGIAAQISPYKAEISAAAGKGKPWIMGETNSATQGGGGISPTFGAALWLMDYSLQLVLQGAKALYFHQGTVGNCQYCWWGRYSMGAPYYGAYFATLALANIDQIASLDSQTTPYAAYVMYAGGSAKKVLLYNSDYYASGTRSSQNFTLTGLTSSSIVTKRLTAPAATSRQDQGGNPAVGGQTFANGTCLLQGTETYESTTVRGGNATLIVRASEALLIYL